MNANLVHKFSITDEEYNPVEGSVLNVKQKVANESPVTHSFPLHDRRLMVSQRRTMPS